MTSVKPFFNLLTESDGEGKGNGEGKERGGRTAGVFCVQNQLPFENDPLRFSLFFFLSVVGTSFGLAERGIQP